MTRADRWAKLSDLAIPAVILGCVLATILRFPRATCPDDALILSYAQRMLDGQIPYVDFYEPNPPLIIYLSVPPVWLGRLFGVTPIAVFNVLVLGACVWSTLSIRRTLIALDLPGRGLLLACWAGLAWATLFSAQSSFTFGQREHLFVLGYVPFLFLRVARWSDCSVPRARAIALGIAAGAMVAIKPQFAIVALVPEAYWILAQRRRGPLLAPEVVAAVAMGVLYLLHFIVFPQIGRAYLETATGLWSTYSMFDDPWSVLANPARVAWVAVATSLAALCPQPAHGDPRRELTAGLVAFSIASFVILYVSSHKAFTYHYEPALHGSVLVIASVIGGTGLMARAWRRSTVVVAISALAFVVATQLDPGVAGMRLVPRLERMIEEHTAPGDHVMMLACGVPPTWPLLLQIARSNASRYPALVAVLPQFYPPGRPLSGYPSRAGVGVRERDFLDTLRDDARLYRPDLVLVERGPCRGVAAGFDLWTYFDKVGFIDDVFGEYRKLGDVQDRTSVAEFGFAVLERADR